MFSAGILLTIVISVFLYTKRKKIISYVLEKEHDIFIQDLHPKAKNLFIDFITATQKKGYNIIITNGYRSFKKQLELKNINPKNASPGLSMHNYGLALDINLQKGLKLWKKATSKAEWLKTGIPQLAKDMGLFWGGDFPNYHDPVHFEIDKNGSTLLAQAKKQFGNNINDIKGNQVFIA